MNEQRYNLEHGYKTPPGVSFTARPASLPNAIYGLLETDHLSLEIFGHSEAGRSQKRSANQDYFYLPLEQNQNPNAGTFVFAIADGVGGASNGDTASEIAVHRLMSDYYTATQAGKDQRDALNYAAQKAHVFVRSESQQRRFTMATTFVGAVFPTKPQQPGQLNVDIACIGDSRAYLLHQGKLEQVTEGSLWYEDEIARGGEHAEWAESQVQANPRLKQSPRTIGGISPEIIADFTDLTLRQGDVILLCSDGLYQPLGNIEGLQPILQGNAHDLNAAAAMLLNAVHRRGRLDDTTLVLVKVNRIGRKSAQTAAGVAPPAKSAGGKMKTWIIAAAILVMALLAAFWLFVGQNSEAPGIATNGDSTPGAVSNNNDPIEPLTDYPTETPSPTVTPTPTPEDTPTPTPQPTATPTEETLPTEELPVEGVQPETDDATGDALATVVVVTSGDCTPGDCKYPAPPGMGAPAPGAFYDSTDPIEFGWSYQSLGLDEYIDVRIYDSPDAAAPIKAVAVRDRNFIRVPLDLPCQEYYWSIRIASARVITPDPGIPGLQIVQTQDYTGARSPESERRPLNWQVNCAGESTETGE